jgi:putative ABC transport system permease protein
VRRSILSSLRAHLGRLIAGCLAIVLGVGFATLALAAHSSAQHSIDETVGAKNAGVDAVILPQQESIRPTDLAAVRKLPQAAEAVAGTSAYLQVTWVGNVRPDYLGVDALQEQAKIAGPRAAAGRLPNADDEIAIPASLADKHKVAVGSKLKVSTFDDKASTVTVVGTVDDSKSVVSVTAVATAGAVKKWEPKGSIENIRVAAKPGVSQEALVAAISGTIGGGLQVYTGAAWIDREVKSLTHGIDVLGGVFGMFAVIALFVACLVIANTFTIVIAQRTREMALLRCVGASRRQVFSSVIAEASVVGVAASAVGVLFGIALVAILLLLAGEFDWGIPPVGVHVDAISLLLPLVFGTIATLVAAVVPARRATRVAPLAALRPEAAPAASSKAGVLRLVLGFLLLAGGGLLLAVGAKTHQVLIGVAGGVISFLGVLAIGSLLVPALIRLLGALPARGGGVPARIAVGNAVRNPKRTAATTSALLIGVTLISLTCVGIASVRKTFDVAMDDEYPVDVMVTATDAQIPATAAKQLQDIKGIIQVMPVRTVLAKAGQEGVPVTGIDLDAAHRVVHSPDLAELKAGTAFVAPTTMNMLNLENGSSLTIVSGKHKLTVKAIEVKGLDPITVAASDLQKLAPTAAITGYWLDSAPDADGPKVIDAVQQSIPTVKNLSVSGGLAERSFYIKVFDVLQIIGVGLLGVSVLIALVGVGNTLSLSVLERTRENALLRALGLTRRQLRGMLAIESLLMALVAAGLGIVLGLIYGWTGTAALMGAQASAGVQYAVPVGLLVTIALVAAVAGLLASVLPARRAAKVAPAGALATE